VALTEDGERQAQRIGQRLHQLRVTPARVLSSPRRRALDTARLAGWDTPEVTHLLVELDYGEYEGRTTADIRSERADWDLFRDGCPGGETLPQAAGRARRLLADLAPDDGDGDIVLFGHGHFLRILGTTYLGLRPEQARHLALDTASISLLGHEHEWRAIRAWNLT
jgi:probable phosphoglycerate mutase